MGALAAAPKGLRQPGSCMLFARRHKLNWKAPARCGSSSARSNADGRNTTGVDVRPGQLSRASSAKLPRRTLLGGSLASLAACGFTPVYGPGGSADALRGSVAVDAPDDRDGFDLVARLEERLGQPVDARYALKYTIGVDQERVGVTPGEETTRYNLVGNVEYSILDSGTGQIVQSGRADTFTGYSTTGTIVGTLSAQQDARSRLMIVLADQIVTELIATAPSWQA